MKDYFRILFKIILEFLPKRNWIFIQSYPYWDDNAIEVYNKFKKDSAWEKIVWSVPDLKYKPPFETTANTFFVKKKSFKELLYYSFSKLVFFTHGFYLINFPKNQLVINLWHGCGYKKIGLELGVALPKANYTIVTSELYRKQFSKAFGVPYESVLDIGYPRNDILLKTGINKSALNGLKKEYTKILVWLPTYRKSLIVKSNVNGVVFDNVFNLSNFDADRFNSFMKEENMICIVKKHPASLIDYQKEFSNIKIIEEDWLLESGITLYELLSVTDLLISDVSSVMIDFLITDKPMICALEDVEEYEKSRGNSLTPLKDWIPAPIISDTDKIIDYITYLAHKNYIVSNETKLLKKEFHTFHDKISVDRLYDIISDNFNF